MTPPIYAVSIRQRHAYAVGAGFKPVENRGRGTDHRGLIAIHSSKAAAAGVGFPLPAANAAFEQIGGMDAVRRQDTDCPPLLRTGAVIAVAVLVDVHLATPGDAHGETCCSPWGQPFHHGPSTAASARHARHLVLANPVPLPEPVPCPGSVTLPFRLTDAVSERIWAQLPRQTMTVTIRDRSKEAAWGSGPTSPRTMKITIPAYCPLCGGRRGEPRGANACDDGTWYWVQQWDNPCGHVDRYEAVLAEALPPTRSGVRPMTAKAYDIGLPQAEPVPGALRAGNRTGYHGQGGSVS